MQEFNTIEEALEDIWLGKQIILVDDEDRENEGDLYCAAEKVTPQIINFMATHGRGLICLTLEPKQVKQLKLPMMTKENNSSFETNFTVSIEAASGVTTGISAFDRAHTIQSAITPNAQAEDIVTPGHIFPIKAREGGVLTRTGQTEGSVDISRLAGLHPSGVICEIMNDDGTMSRYPELRTFADKFDLKMVTIQDLIKYRLKKEILVKKIKETQLSTIYGDFNMVIFQNQFNEQLYLALVQGTWEPNESIPVRVHSQNVIDDVFSLLLTEQPPSELKQSLRIIQKTGKGIYLYVMKDSAPLSILKQIDNFNQGKPEEKTSNEIPAQSNHPHALREFGLGAQVLTELGVTNIRLITSNPDKKIVGLEGYGLNVVEPIIIPSD